MPTAEESPLSCKSPTSPVTGHRRITLQAAVTATTLALTTQVWGWGGDGLYERRYCARGDAENRIKEAQLDLCGRRASCHRFQANQLRLLLAALA